MTAKEILGLPHMRDLRQAIQTAYAESADAERAARGAYTRDSIWWEASAATTRHEAAAAAYEAERARLFALHGVKA